MKVGLVIPIYNRPQYVRRCFDSLRKLNTRPDVVVLVDDYSTDLEIDELILAFVKEQEGIMMMRNDTNSGVRHSLRVGIEAAFAAKCGLVINLDSDAIVKPDFIKRLTSMHLVLGSQMIVTGFNNPKEPVVKGEHHVATFKAHANGINMCFNEDQYKKHIKPALLAKSGNWDYMASESAKLVCVTIPSCVQHIGMHSSMGHVGADVAQDFKQLHLPDVTLFGIDSHDKAGILRAAEISQRDIEFGSVNIITEDLFTKGGTTEQRRQDYSRFMMKELDAQFQTSHVLTIHADGYVINWEAWKEEWLRYDYIGATWWYKDNMNVGNGGFSLRSKKLTSILAKAKIDHFHPEDHHICRTYRKDLEERYGILFAPEEVANGFSIEAYGSPDNGYNDQFGFHGPHVNFAGHDLGFTPIPPKPRAPQQQIYNPNLNQRIINGRKYNK